MPAVKSKRKRGRAMAKTTSAKRSKKSIRKLPGFISFENKKFVLALVVFLTVAGFGSYQIYKNSAAAAYKSPGSISWCRTFKVNLSGGSRGDCVKSVQRFLNDIKGIAGTEGDKMTTLPVTGYYEDRTTRNVAIFERIMFIKSDGVVDADTYDKMWQVCEMILPLPAANAPQHRDYCGMR